MAKPTELVQAILDLLILKIISLETQAWLGYCQAYPAGLTGALQAQQGSLYPALHKAEHQHWIEAEWRSTETGGMAKVYSLTSAGRKQMKQALATWNRLSAAINLVVQEV